MVYWKYYHQLDPFLVQFTSTIGLRWYSLAYISGAVAAYFLAFYFIRKGRLSIPEDKILDIITYGAIGAVLGGRLGYCLFYAPHLFMNLDMSFPFWGILKIHQGGMSSHGGILGLILSQWLYSRFHRISFFSLLDLGALGGSVGLFLGRISNFINGELFGRVIEKKALLGVQFPSEIFLWVERAGEYQKELNSLDSALVLLSRLSDLKIDLPSSYVWGEWVRQAIDNPSYQGRISYICQLIIDMSQDPRMMAVLDPLLSLRHPSQLYQSFFGGLIPFLILSLLWLKPRKAGFISLVWGVVYLLGRVFTEFFRMPDAEIGYQFLELTRGQWLSLFVLIFAGSTYAYFVYKEKPKGFNL